MKYFNLANYNVSRVAQGCMRIASLDKKEIDTLIKTDLDCGINFFDHADIYGGGNCEQVFGDYLKRNKGARDKMFIQSKCGIGRGMFDFSTEHIVSAVEGSLRRLGVDYLDCLLLHRPDTLMIPEEVSGAFNQLESAGKVLNFGVSNHNSMQIELLKTAVKQPLSINQLQFSVTEAGMVTSGMNVNMKNDEATVRDGALLEYSRINKMTIQAWSPFQYGFFKGNFVDSDKFPQLNAKLAEIAEKYGISKTGVATAWILRHPANMQVIVGTMNPDHLIDVCNASDVTLTRSEWYEIYRAAGHSLP